MFFPGFRVSPAVIPKLSVPPSGKHLAESVERKDVRLTCKASRHEYSREASKTSDEGSAWQAPVLATNVMMCLVGTTVDGDAQNDEDDDCCNLECREPVF
jgi:hypothetical protein